MYSSTFVPLAIHKPFAVELDEPDEDDEPPDEDDEPPDEDDEPPDEDDEPPDEDDEPPDDEDDVAPVEDDVDMDEAVVGVDAVFPPQPASTPLMTTATDMILISSRRMGLMTENRFMASPGKFVFERCSRLLQAVSASAYTVCLQPNSQMPWLHLGTGPDLHYISGPIL